MNKSAFESVIII